MKKGLIVFIGMLLIVLVIGYISFQRSDTQDVRILKLAHGLNTRHPVHKTMEYLAQRAWELSDGKLKIEIFPSEQLGNEKECIEALQLGYLAMTKTSTGPMEAFVPRIRIFGIPYLFRDDAHFWQVARSRIGKELLVAGQDMGLRGLCYYDAGFRSFYAKKPIHSPADLKGLKIRVMNSPMAMQMVDTMGGSATPISWGELYTSLDQGVVDAAENNPPSFDTSRHFEICKYYTLDEHLYLPDMLVISSRIWEGLTDEQQEILQRAVDESVEKGHEYWAAAVEASMKVVREDGVEVIKPDKKPFEDAVRPMWEHFEKANNDEDKAIGTLIKQIQEIK